MNLKRVNYEVSLKRVNYEVSLKRVNYIKDMEWDKIIDEKRVVR